MEQKADADVKREMQLAAYQHDLSTANKLVDIVKFYLEAGYDPKYIAHRYSIDVTRCERYVAALTKQKETKREREIATSGDSPPLEGREIHHSP